MKKRISSKTIALGVLLLIVIWLVAVGVLGSSAYSSARKGESTLTAVSHGDITTLKNGSEDTNLAAAAKQLSKAHDRLNNPLLVPVRIFPFVGRQLQSAIALSEAGSKASTVALTTLQQARPLADSAKTDRATSLTQIGTVLKASDAQLRTITLGPKQHLWGPFKDARAKAVTQLNTIDHAFVQGGAGATGLGRLLSTNSSYLLVAANNAEMRNGSGMFLQAGTLTTGGGKLTVTNMQSVGSLNAPDGSINWTGNIQTNWGFLGHEGFMQNLMLSPNFDPNATIAEQIWAKAGKPSVSGVVVMDVSMMKALIQTVGPVSADGITLTADNVTQELLLNQYANVTNASSNQARRDVLSDVASAVFTKFNSNQWDVATAAKSIGQASLGRHLMMFSNDASLNTDWVNAGISGVVAPNELMVSVANLGTNKLDQFLNVDSTMKVTKSASTVDSTLTIKVTNTAPATGSSYVLGPSNSNLVAGEYNGMLTITAPGNSTGLKFDNQLPASVNGPDGNSLQIGTGLDVRRGGSQTFVFHFSQPSGTAHTFVLPSARIPAVTWHYQGENWSDDHTHEVTY